MTSKPEELPPQTVRLPISSPPFQAQAFHPVRCATPTFPFPQVSLGVDLQPNLDTPLDTSGTGRPGQGRRLVLRVTNRVDPNKPVVTQELMAKALRGERIGSDHISDGLGLQHIDLAAQVLKATVEFEQVFVALGPAMHWSPPLPAGMH